jgi:hypothetical protein
VRGRLERRFRDWWGDFKDCKDPGMGCGGFKEFIREYGMITLNSIEYEKVITADDTFQLYIVQFIAQAMLAMAKNKDKSCLSKLSRWNASKCSQPRQRLPSSITPGNLQAAMVFARGYQRLKSTTPAEKRSAGTRSAQDTLSITLDFPAPHHPTQPISPSYLFQLGNLDIIVFLITSLLKMS